MDVTSEKNRGFAFIEFEDPEDAAHALDNMNNAEFYNRVLKINYAKPQAVSKNKASTSLQISESKKGRIFFGSDI
jgi:peptidyl-prolyl isomerase E (cyclophilin E)